ncbi:MAG: hypothetical protein LC713_05425, partial [Actinobacteria bacterium]|nr:hypothetical protein [Actinomycetota bacterium]
PFAAGPDAMAVLVVHGDADGIASYAGGKAVYEEAVAPRYLLTLLGGKHLEPFLAGSDWLDVVDRAAVDFLDRYVAGRTFSVAALLADGEPGLAGMRADP